MVFGIFLFCCNLLIPVSMLIFGIIFLKHPPGKINGFYGYRTTMSMLNQNTWEYAHQYCGRLWKKIGIGMLMISIVVSIPILWVNKDIQGLITCVLETIQVIVLLGSVFPVEQALKKEFDKDGNRKDG